MLHKFDCGRCTTEVEFILT